MLARSWRNIDSAAFLSYGFRPFFLSAGAFSAIGVLLWLPVFLNIVSLPVSLSPRDWHAHEMLYGYAAAAIAGFLLTAVPNWTGRPAMAGRPLFVLLVAWLLGRVAMAMSALIGLLPAALADLLFLPLLAMLVGQELVLAGNRRNYKILAILGLLFAGNVVFHLEAMGPGAAEYGVRAGLGTIVMLVMVIGGRIIPNFTRSTLLRVAPGRLPRAFDRFDVAALAITAVALVAWVALPSAIGTSVLCLVAALLQTARLTRWAGDRARCDALTLILHVAYAFIPLGFLLIGLEVSPSAGVHAWGTGAIGLMTLAVMTRATLGHTGRQLSASNGTVVVYGLAIFAAVVRVAAAFPSPMSIELLEIAGAAWVLAFCGFAVIYGPMMLRPRPTNGPTQC